MSALQLRMSICKGVHVVDKVVAGLDWACSMQGIRTFLAINDSKVVEAKQGEGAAFAETWQHFADDAQLKALHPGDSRAALAPFLAHQVFFSLKRPHPVSGKQPVRVVIENKLEIGCPQPEQDGKMEPLEVACWVAHPRDALHYTLHWLLLHVSSTPAA